METVIAADVVLAVTEEGVSGTSLGAGIEGYLSVPVTGASPPEVAVICFPGVDLSL